MSTPLLGKFDVEVAEEEVSSYGKLRSESKVIVIGLRQRNTSLDESRRLKGAEEARQYANRYSSTVDQAKELIAALQKRVDEIEKSN